MILRFNSVLKLDQDCISRIKVNLKSLANKWKNADCIPKRACDIFVDFYPAMESVASQYSEKDAQKIIELADDIMMLIRECYS